MLSFVAIYAFNFSCTATTPPNFLNYYSIYLTQWSFIFATLYSIVFCGRVVVGRCLFRPKVRPDPMASIILGHDATTSALEPSKTAYSWFNSGVVTLTLDCCGVCNTTLYTHITMSLFLMLLFLVYSKVAPGITITVTSTPPPNIQQKWTPRHFKNNSLGHVDRGIWLTFEMVVLLAQLVTLGYWIFLHRGKNLCE